MSNEELLTEQQTTIGGLALDATGRRAQLITDVREGLRARPRTLPSKYFYDARGSDLFDQITRLEEYYPTRTERSILVERADTIAATTGAQTLLELGSGTSDKTRLLLDALHAHGTLGRFVPLDVDPVVLGDAAVQLRDRYPDLSIEPVVADFEQRLPRVNRQGPQLLVFLGSTVGNLAPEPRLSFLRGIAEQLQPGDHFLLGTDLVKSQQRLLAAYDDPTGVTAEFNRNVLRVLNAELGGDFDPDGFQHVVRWNVAEEWIEMWLRASSAMTVDLPGAGISVHLDAGDEIRTEISAKFRRDRLTAELGSAGLMVLSWLTDPQQDFAVSLCTPSLM